MIAKHIELTHWCTNQKELKNYCWTGKYVVYLSAHVLANIILTYLYQVLLMFRLYKGNNHLMFLQKVFCVPPSEIRPYFFSKIRDISFLLSTQKVALVLSSQSSSHDNKVFTNLINKPVFNAHSKSQAHLHFCT